MYKLNEEQLKTLYNNYVYYRDVVCRDLGYGVLEVYKKPL